MSDRLNWAIDGHENVVAEVAAALGLSRGRARGRLRYAIALRERLPRVAEVFARGLIDFRLVAAVVSRTELVEDPVLIAKLDAAWPGMRRSGCGCPGPSSSSASTCG